MDASSLASAPVPSLSPLTGHWLPPEAALALYQRNFRPPNRRGMWGAPTPSGDGSQRGAAVQERSGSQPCPSTSHSAGIGEQLSTSRPGTGTRLGASSSWSGPLTSLAQQQLQQQQQQQQRLLPSSRLGTPSGQPLSQTPHAALLQQTSSRPGTSANRPSTSASRPGTSTSRPGTTASRPGTGAIRPGTSASRPGTGMSSGSRAEVWSRDGDASGATAEPSKVQVPAYITGMNPRMAALAADPETLSRANSAPASTATTTSFRPFTQRHGTTAALKATGGMDAPKPSRGLLYAVYQDLDKYGEGRITFSAFVDAAASLGMSKQQSDDLFALLDKQQRGYFTIGEWGEAELQDKLSDFSRLYAAKPHNTVGRDPDAVQMDNLCAAIQLAAFKLRWKNNGYPVGQERLMEAFKFMDLASSGNLKPADMHDAFDGLGIYVNKKMLDDAMKVYTGSDGSVQYPKFIGNLFEKSTRRGNGLRTFINCPGPQVPI